jgi:hypothetical protein
MGVAIWCTYLILRRLICTYHIAGADLAFHFGILFSLDSVSIG